MPNLRLVLAAVRVVTVLALVAVFAKIGPILASHATGHSTTYSPGQAIHSPLSDEGARNGK